MSKPKKFNLQRSLARALVMQALYSRGISENDIAQVKSATLETYEGDLSKVDIEYFEELFTDICSKIEELDAVYNPFLKNQPGPIEVAILRLAVYEMVYRMDVPDKVVINEAVELAKTYGVNDGHKFINGVLDKALKTTRKTGS